MLLTSLHRSQSLLPAWTASYRLDHVRHYVDPTAGIGATQFPKGRPRFGPLSAADGKDGHDFENRNSAPQPINSEEKEAFQQSIDIPLETPPEDQGQNSNASLGLETKRTPVRRTYRRGHPNTGHVKQYQSSSSTPSRRKEEALPKEPRKSTQKLSLFEQLFPEEAAKTNIQAKKNGNPRPESPVLLREADWAKEWKKVSSSWSSQNLHTTISDKEMAYTHMAKGFDPQEMRRRRDASVLILSNAGRNLAESDFLRLSAKGQHIEGWTSGIIKVIPGRDSQTLEPLGHYFILFSTATAARAYQDTVIRLHDLARTYSPKPLGNPIPIPPGYIKDGEDVHALLQSFTLVAPSQPTVSLRMLHPKYHSPSIKRMIVDGGHPPLVARQKKCEDLVLLSLNTGHSGLRAHELAQMLGRDARERNLPWGLVGGDDAIVKLEAKREEEDVGADVAHDAGKKRRRGPPRFILSFRDAPEARRFVRAWHRRLLPVTSERISEGEEGPIVNAELLW